MLVLRVTSGGEAKKRASVMEIRPDACARQAELPEVAQRSCTGRSLATSVGQPCLPRCGASCRGVGEVCLPRISLACPCAVWPPLFGLSMRKRDVQHTRVRCTARRAAVVRHESVAEVVRFCSRVVQAVAPGSSLVCPCANTKCSTHACVAPHVAAVARHESTNVRLCCTCRVPIVGVCINQNHGPS